MGYLQPEIPRPVLPGRDRLNQNYFRDYDPQVGRYLEGDPIGLRGGINPYVYVHSNPLNGADPEGLFFCPCGTQLEIDWSCVVAWESTKDFGASR
jgi:hypothetical protein